MALKLEGTMPAMFIVGLVAIVAILGMFAVSTAAPAEKMLNDHACYSKAQSVLQRAEAIYNNPNAQCGSNLLRNYQLFESRSS